MSTDPVTPDAMASLYDRARLSAEVRIANERALAMPPDPNDLSRPPRPVPGCSACLTLAERREVARAEYDRSAETDANVLLRTHQRQEHRP
ncbi:hypothetical protein Shyhy01_41560 [Streptomyces hygroscopicus subsp. hygroscopicus]|uniref:hypothetical protein n=1 Tax=Streptomyces sp. KHY 26 TaxID=3097359 RepID=UPI0024A21123|nr:hypothetical protein [Streptomyces hygroscopicus]GLX51206.1 hypothetical protein Shyhy01_41560 [Streptomyces hygroscopicus subsp. hygroscopicus]